MTTLRSLPCDGCGQQASPEHIARRLQRLEWTTRYRPVHIGTLLLGAVSPQNEVDFLYAGKFEGEAGLLLDAAGIQAGGKTPEMVLAEFQRGGYFLTHVLECPLEEGAANGVSAESLLVQRVAAVLARVRRSLKPKRVVPFGEQIASVVGSLSGEELRCPVILDAGTPFSLEVAASTESFSRLRRALGLAGSAM